jgi:hypothetical protein
MGLFNKVPKALPEVPAIQPKPTGRPKIREFNEDEIEVDDGEEEYEEDVIETRPKPVMKKQALVMKPKTIVVRELPTEAIRQVTNEKTGERIKLMTIEEALTRLIEYIEEED